MEFLNTENNESEINHTLTSEVYQPGISKNTGASNKSIPVLDYKLESLENFSSSSSKKIIDLIQSQALELAFPDTIQEVIEPSETLYDYDQSIKHKNTVEEKDIKEENSPEHLRNKSSGFEEFSPRKHFNKE